MGDIKSAWEIAMEKAAQVEAATPQERMQWEYLPQGERLGVKYLKDNINLLAELQKYPENVKPYVSKGVQEVLIRNIELPKTEVAKKTTRQAMDGLKLIKQDKVAIENVFSKIRRLFGHYSQQGQRQRQEAYEALKVNFAAKLQEAVRKQTGANTPVDMNVERLPQFQDEWRRVESQLDFQYTQLIDEAKEELRALP